MRPGSGIMYYILYIPESSGASGSAAPSERHSEGGGQCCQCKFGPQTDTERLEDVVGQALEREPGQSAVKVAARSPNVCKR